MGTCTAFQFFNQNGDYLTPNAGFTDYGNILSESPIFAPIIAWERINIITHNTDGVLYYEKYFQVLETKFKIQKEDLDFFFFENSYNDCEEDFKLKIYPVNTVIDKFNKYISIFDTSDFMGTSVVDSNSGKLITHFPQNYPFSEIGYPFDNNIEKDKKSRIDFLNQLQEQKFVLQNGDKVDILFVKETTLRAYTNQLDELSACLEKNRNSYVAGTWW